MYVRRLTHNNEKIYYFSTEYFICSFISEPCLMYAGCKNKGTGGIIPAGCGIILRHWKSKDVNPLLNGKRKWPIRTSFVLIFVCSTIEWKGLRKCIVPM